MDKNEIEELRARRALLHEAREHQRLRAAHGPTLAAIVAAASGKSITLEDFHPDRDEPLSLIWPTRIEDASGLVAPYISNSAASDLLACFQSTLGNLSGLVGFHDKRFLGLADLKDMAPTSLLAAAEASEDSVLFYVDEPRGVLMVDCYPCPPADPFSIVVQGPALIDALRPCFQMARG